MIEESQRTQITQQNSLFPFKIRGEDRKTRKRASVTVKRDVRQTTMGNNLLVIPPHL